jgi:hypothetical protein
MCKGDKDEEEQARKEWSSLKSGQMSFKISLKEIVRTCDCPTVKLHESEFLTAKRVKCKRA